MRIVTHMVRRFALLAVLPVLALTSVGCDSAEDEPDVSFTVISQTGNCVDNNGNPIACIEFFARPNVDVIVTAVEIEFPTGEDETFNAGQVSVIANESVALQDANTAYPRLSGPWKFSFRGTRVGGGSFTAETTINVSA